ncbi:hypothetical protein LTS18_005516 [Coniosporium uncinatum]|uniref:Uncharacterized protein n=1 Tax=Coniosporium uncinatum TaxID=93489 RepID=A0ACC3D4J2_9PEZI|nr:hypothetical protein LTS18_005516 [Coniosporium uncinatum]
MISHGQDFDHDSQFGNCLISLGRANEAISRKQETYNVGATSTWLESLERSLAQMKEYQAARKKLEQRRLAYDASLAKMQKAKREDFRVEEELRAQKAKYEETSEDVYRRMMDIKEAEVESVNDLSAFLEAELTYYDSCREVLMNLKRQWPGTQSNGGSGYDRDARRPNRSRSNTTHSYSDRFSAVEEEDYRPEPKLMIPKFATRTAPHSRDHSPALTSPSRPTFDRRNTTEVAGHRDYSPVGMPRLTRIPTESSVITMGRSQLRPVSRDVFDDPSSEYTGNSSSPDRYNGDYMDSPATSVGSRSASWSVTGDGAGGIRKAPPPPPPSRAKKPAPPPPPMKRSALSTSEVPYA